MKNKVLEIIDSHERTEHQIQFIVNRFFLGDDDKRKKLKDYLHELVNNVLADMREIHNLK